MATIIINSAAQNSVNNANGEEKLRLFANATTTRMVAAYGTGLPDDFSLIYHEDLRYVKKDGSESDKCYCGLVPKFGGVEHMELAMLQWDLLISDIPSFNTDGTFKEFFTPGDELHTFARETADATKSIKEWLQGIANHFDAKSYKFVAVSYVGKNKYDKVYTVSLLGIDHK